MIPKNPYGVLGREVRVEEYVRNAPDVETITSSFRELTGDLSACVLNPSVIGPPKNYLTCFQQKDRTPEVIGKYARFYEEFSSILRSDSMILTHRAKSLLKRLISECMFTLHGDKTPASRQLCNNLQQTYIEINRKEPYNTSHHTFKFFDAFSAEGRGEFVDSCNHLEKREIAAIIELSAKCPGKTALVTRDRRQRNLAGSMIKHFNIPADLIIYDPVNQCYRRFVF